MNSNVKELQKVTNKRHLSRLLFTLVFLVAACGGSERVTDASGVPVPNVVAPEVDAATANSIEEALSSPDPADHELAAGDWVSDSFSEPIAFHLSEPGRVLLLTNGALAIESGPIDNPTGRIAIIEAIAFATPDGAAPLGVAPLGSEFPLATVTDRGLVGAQGRLLSWADVRLESDVIPESLIFECGADEVVPCTQVFVTQSEGSSVPLAPLDFDLRFVGQDFGARRLYVAASAMNPVDELNFREGATEVAASIVLTESDWAGRRPISTLEQRGEPVPAGTWFAALGGYGVEVRSDAGLENVTLDFLDERAIVFTTTEPDSRAGFFAITFNGFIDAVDVRTPSPGDPLSAEEFIEGLSQVTEVMDVTDSEIVGQDAITWEFAPLDPDSAFACIASERDDLGDEDLCTTWSANGARRVQFASEPVVQGQHYIPELGMIIAWSYTDMGDGNPFSGIIEALTVSNS